MSEGVMNARPWPLWGLTSWGMAAPLFMALPAGPWLRDSLLEGRGAQSFKGEMAHPQQSRRMAAVSLQALWAL